jgi:hypothetical protein
VAATPCVPSNHFDDHGRGPRIDPTCQSAGASLGARSAPSAASAAAEHASARPWLIWLEMAANYGKGTPLFLSLSFRSSKLGWFGLARSLSLLSSPEDAGLQEGEREGRKAGPGAAATEKVRIFPSLFLLCSYSLALLRECTSLEIGDVRSCGRCSLCSRQSLPLSRWICVADSSALVSGEGSRGSRLIDWSIDWSDGGVPKRANADASIRRIPIGLGEAAK